MIRFVSIYFLLFAALSSSAHASQVLWGSARFANNYLSSGSPNSLTGDFTFQLGAFEPGFKPTRDNISEWLDHWTAGQSASYNQDTRFFTGSFVYGESISPFLPTNQGYIFGFDRRFKADGEEFGEWLLVTNESWRWPRDSGISPPVQWSVSTATEVVVGSINDPGKAFHMKTERVALTQDASPLQQWIESNLGGLGANAALDADPDHDLLSNLMEFALGTDPNKPTPSRSPNIQLSASSAKLGAEIVFRKDGLQPSVTLGIEISDNLADWQPGANAVPITAENSLFIRFRDDRPRDPQTPRYYRLTATLAE